jgi:UrcA family protein
MRAQRRLRRSSTTVVAAGCVAFSAVLSSMAFADPPTLPASSTVESRVSLAGLDLSTEEGVRVARRRLKATAEHLCRQLGDANTASFRWTYAACVRDTLANALEQLNAPVLAAVAQ